MASGDNLKETIEKIREGIGSPYLIVEDKDKKVQFANAEQIRDHLRLASDLDCGPSEAVVVRPKRPLR